MVRRACSLALVGLVAAMAPRASRADATDGPTLRVLVARAASSLEIAHGDPPRRLRIVASGAGLRVGGRAVGAEARFDGPVVALGGRRYRGGLRVLRRADGIVAVNDVALESYLAGVVTRETYASFGADALKAQAVAARTYALHERARRRGADWDLAAGTDGQVYGGLAGETPEGRAAVDATRGEVLLFEGAPILAAFHSASGGRTASAEEVWGRPVPYLQSVATEGEDLSPDTYWRLRVSSERLSRAVAACGEDVGAVRELRVDAFSPSGRAQILRAVGSRGETRLESRRLRETLGDAALRSTLFRVRRDGDDFVFVGTGRGHGVGMSQWGARAMVERGAGYQEILARFYPGAELARHFEEAGTMALRRDAWDVSEAGQ